ncbi:MAG TPA: hypothetical protein PKA64_19675 [Myxococcota bacterium]|nr:hypothetical protein [Myxococcota bacterium]
MATWTAPDVVWDVAASPDGRRIAVACGDSVVVRSADLAGAVDWSAELDDTVTSVAFSHDGVLVIAVCDDGTISWWHVEGGRLAGRIEGHASGTCVAPHPSEALLAVADERGVVGALRYAPGALLRLVRDATLVNPSDAERARYLFGLLPST